ncbi:hypothetical protein LINPERHAP1_LOCUS35512 [Linum perenne]
MGIFSRSALNKKPNDSSRLIIMTFFGVVFGFSIGVSFPSLSVSKLNFASGLLPTIDLSYMGDKKLGLSSPPSFNSSTNRTTAGSSTNSTVGSSSNNTAGSSAKLNGPLKIWAPSNPRGAETLPPGIIEAESDFNLRRLWGNPSEDVTKKPKYLVTFTVGYNQRHNIDACVKKFSGNFTILLFHYDGKVSEWDEFEWSKQAIHVSARKQTKWWYAKRFLHPDIVASYDYIFIWDEDLGVEHFNAEEYIKLVKKHGLEISQPGLEPNKGLTWQMTRRRGDQEVHNFVEIMAPVFSRAAWRCVWYMIQNDLVHGWGLDFALRRCVEPAHEKIGVVDSQWIVHQGVPSLGNQVTTRKNHSGFKQVRERCRKEWTMFQNRVAVAENDYFKNLPISQSNSSAH